MLRRQHVGISQTSDLRHAQGSKDSHALFSTTVVILAAMYGYKP